MKHTIGTSDHKIDIAWLTFFALACNIIKDMKCFHNNCKNMAEIGAHMHYKSSKLNDNHVYIIPVCKNHHQNGGQFLLKFDEDEMSNKHVEVGTCKNGKFKPYTIEKLINLYEVDIQESLYAVLLKFYEKYANSI